MSFVPIEVGPYWADLNEHLCDLVALVPPDRLDEAPVGEWGVREVAHHIVGGRDHWLANSLGRERGEMPSANAGVEELQGELRASWERVASFLGDAEALDREYEPPAGDPPYVDPPEFRGHYVAFHRLAHDVHHRAQLLDRIRDLGLEVPEAIRRRPL
ncbi:MAG: hypothetical protein HOH95_12345 [Dehalococcoidia bacterium]|jgi:uncharacterized damage-inducible protein DinB|nr:hypothetical protein [Dehalococcoidia bacterium]